MITQDQLKSVLNYNPENGYFTWNTNRHYGSMRHGEVAGNVAHNKWIQIKINGKSYPASKLAWLYIHGEYPETAPKHINQNSFDNRISNLSI